MTAVQDSTVLRLAEESALAGRDGHCLTSGPLATACGTAVGTTTAVESTTALTTAGCDAPASATTQQNRCPYYNTETINPMPPTEKGRMVRETFIEPTNSRLLGLFLSQPCNQVEASGRTWTDEHQRTDKSSCGNTDDENCANSMVATARLVLNRMCTYSESSQS